jgi:hypothetical protein
MNKKKSFALFLTIIALVSFSYLSLSILETNSISSNIDKLKYLHLQANIHLKYIKKYISSHSKEEIKNFNLSDERFNISIKSIEENNNTTTYHISINTKDNTNIRIYSMLN